MTSLADERMSAIHLLRAGQTVSEVAQQLGHSERWVRKWWQRSGPGSLNSPVPRTGGPDSCRLRCGNRSSWRAARWKRKLPPALA
jgi:transposase-like protein